MFIPNRDSNGDPIYKPKVTQVGWVYDQRVLVFETSVLASLINKKFDGSDWNDATIKFYNISGTELTTQSSLDSDCVKTIIDWEMVAPFDLIGGLFHNLAIPEGYQKDAQIWTVAVPDLPSSYGGSVNMIDGRTIVANDMIVADGRGVKTLYYDANYHTNKMRTVITHSAGSKLRNEIVFEIFYGR